MSAGAGPTVKVLVVGAGAVGSVLGARLATAGETVTLVARAEHVRAIEARGLSIEGVGAGVTRLRAVSEIPVHEQFEAVILSTKTFDLDAAARQLGERLAPTPTLLIQNGLGIEGTAVGALADAGWPNPGRWVVRAVQSIPATFLGPGRVRAIGVGEIVLPRSGEMHDAERAARTFSDLLQRTGIRVRTTTQIDREVWKKALVNAAINPVTALHGVVNGTLLEGALRAEALALLEEARTVALAAGVRFTPEEALAEFDRVVRASADNRSSMLQDVERGRPTEVEAILGELLRRGNAAGVDLPATRAALAAVRARVARRP